MPLSQSVHDVLLTLTLTLHEGWSCGDPANLSGFLKVKIPSGKKLYEVKYEVNYGIFSDQAA